MADTGMAPMPGSAVDAGKGQLDAILKQLLARSGGNQLQMPQPQVQATKEQLTPKGYNMQEGASNRQEIGIAMGNMGTFIHNMVAKHKEIQTRDAMAEWQGFDRALEKAQVLAGDPSAPDYKEKVQKMLSEDPFVKANLDPSNPKAAKRLKNMYKALNVDLLDDKENVHRAGLKQMFKAKEAFSKVEGASKKLAEYKQQQTQGGTSPDQMQEAIAGLMSKAQPQRPPVEQQEKAVQLGIEKERADTEAQKAAIDKFQIAQATDPETGRAGLFAVDKTHPEKGAIPVKVDGKAVGAQSKFSQAQVGKAVTIEGKPYGVASEHGILTPEDPNWGPPQARSYDAANRAYAIAEGKKQELAGIRAQTYLASREYGVLNTKTGQLEMAGPTKINSAPEGTYAPVSGAMAAMGKEAVFKDIYYNIGNVEEAAKNLKHGFSAAQRAQFILAMRSTEPQNAFATFLSSEVAPKQQDQIDYLTAIASLQENSMALRTVAGLGAGSDSLREAILRTVPGPQTPNYATLKRQLDLFKGTAERLETAVPQLGNDSEGNRVIDLTKP